MRHIRASVAGREGAFGPRFPVRCGWVENARETQHSWAVAGGGSQAAAVPDPCFCYLTKTRNIGTQGDVGAVGNHGHFTFSETWHPGQGRADRLDASVRN